MTRQLHFLCCDFGYEAVFAKIFGAWIVDWIMFGVVIGYRFSCSWS